MTNEQFAAYLLDESHLYTVGYEELKTLVMNYPYSANLRVMLLKKSLFEKNKDAERNLSMAAAYVTDRRQLSKTVKRLKNPIKISENVVLAADFLELTELSNLDKVLADKTIPLDFTNTPEKEKSLTLDLPTEQLTPFSLDLPLLATGLEAREIVSNLETDSQSLAHHIEAEDFQEELKELPATEIKSGPAQEIFESVSVDKISDNALGEDLDKYRAIPINDNDIDLLYASLTEKNKNNEIEQHHTTHLNASEMPIEFEITNTNKTVIKEASEPATEALPKVSFTAWLQQFRVNEPPLVSQIVENIPAVSEMPQKEIIIPIKTTFAAATCTPANIPSTTDTTENHESVLELKETIKSRASKKVKFDSLAQLFESSESVPDNLFESPEKKAAGNINEHIIAGDHDDDDKPLNGHAENKKNDMHDLAVKSILSNDDILSETLADIHFKQGNFARATEMYERLMLQNPEKSDYFAAKINQNLQNVPN